MYHKCINFRRHQRERWIKRKVNIALSNGYYLPIKKASEITYCSDRFYGEFNKGKIFCNCYACQLLNKTRYAGYKTSDKKKFLTKEDEKEVEFMLYLMEQAENLKEIQETRCYIKRRL